MTPPTLRVILATSLGAVATSTAAFAQTDDPTGSIKLIVPFTAGGGVDKKSLRSLLPQFPGAPMLDGHYIRLALRWQCRGSKPKH